LKNGTIFHFITEGIHQALDLAGRTARGKNVRTGGGANTIRQYLRERLIDELHFAIAPVLPGKEKHFFETLTFRHWAISAQNMPDQKRQHTSS
jgi:dihydrofolate reductase